IEWGEDCNIVINSEEVEISANPEYYYGEWQFDSKDWQFIVDWENRVAFITAVPEPAEWAMILGGVALLFAIRRKRK
ncbi:MAG: PEP-CTERM sorting domain-containing protein, partial [Opitutales bacterium]|nr:PEP-CTERM sorting domain-containing protein [Opitutales bacterium]